MSIQIVDAGYPVDSDSFFAARPVCAHNAISLFGFFRWYHSISPRTVVVFPVPGPPVRIEIPGRVTSGNAFLCVSLYWISKFSSISLISSSGTSSSFPPLSSMEISLVTFTSSEYRYRNVIPASSIYR